jgi:hypothetical protein
LPKIRNIIRKKNKDKGGGKRTLKFHGGCQTLQANSPKFLKNRGIIVASCSTLH